MTTPAPFVAPPSVGHQEAASKSDIVSKLTALTGGLAQAKTDSDLMATHINGWSTYTATQQTAATADLLPIIKRLVDDMATIAVGVSDIVTAQQVVPTD